MQPPLERYIPKPQYKDGWRIAVLREVCPKHFRIKYFGRLWALGKDGPEWKRTADVDKELESIVEYLTSEPILKTLSARKSGLWAVLMQQYDELLHACVGSNPKLWHQQRSGMFGLTRFHEFAVVWAECDSWNWPQATYLDCWEGL
jgi:hypothetical protein